MYPVAFDHDRAVSLLASIRRGKPIEPPSSRGWSTSDLLTLAGACLFAANSHGNLPHATFGIRVPAARVKSPQDCDLAAELHGIVSLYADLAALICDGTYQKHFDPLLKGTLTAEARFRAELSLVTGCRKWPWSA